MRRATLTTLLACTVTAMPAFAAAQAAPPPADRILVMPLENATHERALFWLGEASAVLLADNVNALGGTAITRAERLQAFARLQVPAASGLTDATVIRLGQLVGAVQVIVGSLALENGALAVHVRNIALEAGRLQSNVTERGAVADLFEIFDRVTRNVVPLPGRISAPVGERPPVAAFENYVKGLLADTPATAVGFLNASLRVAPGYDRARLALWDVYGEQGQPQRALEAVQAVRPDSAWARPAQFLAGLSYLGLRKYEEAFASFKALSEQGMTPTALNNLGVVQLRRGATPQSGLATYYFDKAVEADPDDPDYAFNLGYAYWEARDPQAAIYWLREAVRRNPADGDAHFVLGAALAATGGQAESMRERELARRLSSTYEQWEKRPGADQVPKGLERVKKQIEVSHARRIETRLAVTGQRDQQELAGFYVERAGRLYQQQLDRDAVAELERALYLSPYLADAHLLLGRIHLRNGRVAEAIGTLKISLWSAETADAHVVLARAYLAAKDTASARAEAQRALQLAPSSVEASEILAMLKSP